MQFDDSIVKLHDMITRDSLRRFQRLATKYPVITLTGPRQSGKTTLCKIAFPKKPYVSLENLDEREFAQSDPRTFLKRYPNGAIFDEVQRAPWLVSYLQEIVDSDKRKGLFILTGSQQLEISQTISQSLAGRTGLLRLLPFGVDELSKFGEYSKSQLIYKGCYPRLYAENISPNQFYGDYLETYVERDLRQLITIKDLSLFRKFLRLAAGRTGQILNLLNLGNDTGISHSTAREWISILEASYIVYLLEPFYTNTSKRLIKSPKLYFYDTGLVCYLLGINSHTQVMTHPLFGNLFENLALVETLKSFWNRGIRKNILFFRDAVGNEIDLVIESNPKNLLIEIKSAETVHRDFFQSLKKFPSFFPKIPIDKFLIYGGSDSYERESTRVIGFRGWAKHLEKVIKK